MPLRDERARRRPRWSRACAARCRCGWSWCSASTTARASRGCAARRRQRCRRSPGPTRCCLRTPVPTRGRGPHDASPTSRSARASGARSCSPGIRLASRRPRPGRRAGGDRRHGRVVARTGRRAARTSGRWREPVLRSLITLKALTYGPTGGIVAAPDHLAARAASAACATGTTATAGCATRRFTPLRAACDAGYIDEARRLARLAAARGGRRAGATADHVRPGGERRLTELELDWLPGYEGSRAGADRQRRRPSSSSSTSTAR